MAGFMEDPEDETKQDGSDFDEPSHTAAPPKDPKIYLVMMAVAVVIVLVVGALMISLGGNDDEGSDEDKSELRYNFKAMESGTDNIAKGAPLFSINNIGLESIQLSKVDVMVSLSDDSVLAVPYDAPTSSTSEIKPGGSMMFQIPDDWPSGLKEGSTIKVKLVEKSTGNQVGSTSAVNL